MDDDKCPWYRHPHYFAFFCPLLFFGIKRIQLLKDKFMLRLHISQKRILHTKDS